MVGRLKSNLPAGLSIPDGVDPFEYTDIISASSFSTPWVLISAFVVLPDLSLSGAVGMWWNIPPCWVTYVALIAFVETICPSLLGSSRRANSFHKLNELFYTQPGCRTVRAVLLGWGVIYALFLLCVPSSRPFQMEMGLDSFPQQQVAPRLGRPRRAGSGSGCGRRDRGTC